MSSDPQSQQKSEAGNSQRKRKNPQRSTRKERRCYESCHKSQREPRKKDALGTRRIEANPRLPKKRHMVPSHIKRQGEAMNAGPLLPLVRQSRKQTAHALCRCRASRQSYQHLKVSPATHLLQDEETCLQPLRPISIIPVLSRSCSDLEKWESSGQGAHRQNGPHLQHRARPSSSSSAKAALRQRAERKPSSMAIWSSATC